MNRRSFLTGGILTIAGSTLSSSSESKRLDNSPISTRDRSHPKLEEYPLMEEVLKYRKIDAHAHVYFEDDVGGYQVRFGERLGIDKQVVSRYLHVMPGTPEQFREFNNLTIEAMKRYPDRLLGGFVLNPEYQKESLEEIDRCVDAGMIGTGELYYQVKINDPKYFPIIERLIDLKMIIHSHAECQMGVGGYRMKYTTNKQPNTSIPEDFVAIAQRYPEGIFQWAHIGMGGDWEYECKMFADYPNIYVDTSGSNNAEGMIDFAVEQIGEDRIFYASDSSYYQSIGKILTADLTDKQRRKIFFDNYNNILKKGGRGVD